MRNKHTIIALTAAALTAIACSSSGGDTEGPGAQGNAAAADDGAKTIEMEVTGPAKADITYGLNVDQSQESGAKLPWKKKITSKEALTTVVVLAQNSASGTIGCTIKIDGKVVKTNKSSGEYATVTCTADNS